MKKLFLLGLFTLFLFSACEKYDEDVLPIAGVYEAHISGIAGPFSMNITVDYGDNIKIEAPWLDDTWTVIEADVDDKEYFKKDIDIFEQHLENGIRIYGDGVWQDYSIQIDYTIEDGNDLYHYTLIGTKL